MDASMTTEPAAPAKPVSNFNLANRLTAARFGLAGLMVWAFVAYGFQPVGRWLEVGFFALAMATDFLDGRVARSRNLVTELGKHLDPLADKATMVPAVVALAWFGVLPWWAVAVIVLRDAWVTLLRRLVHSRGYGTIPATRLGKIKTGVLTAMILLYLVPVETVLPLGDAWLVLRQTLMWAVVVLFAVTTIEYTALAWKKNRQ